MKLIGLEFFSKISSLMKIGISQPSLIKLFAAAYAEHRQVEELFSQKLAQCDSGSRIDRPFQNLNSIKYFEKNFFSMLFLSIFKSLKIPYDRIMLYGMVLHSLRIIITCTDNILDSESKGPVFLNAGLDNNILNNTMLSLLSYRVMGQSIRELTNNGSLADDIESRILDSICSIGKGESVTKLIDVMPCPEEITETIHQKIGGELLRLALIAPLEAETKISESLTCMESGILYIGNALQMLDDLTDVSEDVLNSKINYFASWIIHKEEDGLKTLSDITQSANEENLNFSLKYPNSASSVIDRAIELALEGFEMLSRGGYPVNSSQATEILKIMFGLRGLSDEWELSQCA